MLNKKGILQSVWWFMIDLVLTIAVFFFLSYFVDQVGESTTFEKNFLARDISLLMDALYSAPGNVKINYPQNTMWFDFSFEQNMVQVYDTTKNPNPPITMRVLYPFMEDKNLFFEYKTASPAKKAAWKKTIVQTIFPTLTTAKPITDNNTAAKLEFTKTTDKIAINQEESVNKLICPIFSIAKPTKIIIMPKTGNLSTFTNALSTLIKDSEKADFVSINDNADIILQIVQKDENVLRAKIKPNSDKSRRLACLIINNILDINLDLEPSIIPSEEEILNSAGSAVILEIGKGIIDDSAKMTLAISDAFKEYPR